MGSFQYTPYEELTGKLDVLSALALITPWVHIELEYPAEEEKSFSALVTDLNNNTSSQDISDLLSTLERHFVAYSKPRSLNSVVAQNTKSAAKVQRLEHDQPSSWADTFLPGLFSTAHLQDKNWKWNPEEILKKSENLVQNNYDPSSAYRAIMRLVLKEMCFQERGPKLLVDHMRNLAKQNEQLLFEASRLFVRQYHHITSTSSDCLMPAMYNMPYAKHLVFELVKEEHGHGVFTLSTFKELGGKEILDLPLDPYTAGLMDLLKLSAYTNPLAFSCLFTIFEMSGEQDDDPLATILKQSSLPASSKGLEKHFQLNKDGAHFQSGFPLIETLQGVCRESIIEAVRFSELLMIFFDLSSRDIIRKTTP